MKKGIVYLVGAGPGDPGLITVKGADCLRKADIVVYDYLANPVLLNLAPLQSKKLYVGKKGATHSAEQQDINALLVAEARRGKTVVRLKGGDPYVFGRGGEEAEALAEAGVPFEVVPGVTSAIGVPAYAGIPVTHRDFTSSVAFVTGHEQDERGGAPPDWSALSKIGTLVFLMAYGNLAPIVEKLIEAGLDPKTPAAMIEWGTLPRQKTAFSDLAGIGASVQRVGIRPPTILVIGRVVGLRDKIDWFEKRPLLGKRILVTRSRAQAGELAKLLEQEGAEVVEVPTIEIKPPRSWKALDQAIRRIAGYDWIVFTSVNGVAAFFERMKKQGADVRALKGVRLAVVGPSTARAIAERGIAVDCVAKEFQAEGLLKALSRHKLAGKRVLVCRAQEGREVLIEGLKKLKARVTLVEAYRSLMPRSGDLPKILPDLMTFTSSKIAENFGELIRQCKDAAAWKKIPVATIGPVTTKTAKRLGFNVAGPSRHATLTSLVSLIKEHFGKTLGR